MSSQKENCSVNKTTRLTASQNEGIKAISKKRREKDSDTIRYFIDSGLNGEILSPKTKLMLPKLREEYTLRGLTPAQQLENFIEKALAHDGIGNSETDIKKFDCNKLCKKARTCTSNAMFELGEINACNCYISKYPYEYTNPQGKTFRLCKFMVFPNGFQHDPQNPYPQCIAKQKDIPIQLPKDRVMRNPEICWTCYKIRKQAKKEELARKKEQRIFRSATRGQPRINFPHATSY